MDKIYECEVKRQYLINGAREWRWKRVPASEAIKGDEVRCCHCQGRVRLHKQKIVNGPADHVEHFTREDSEKCPVGFYFKKSPLKPEASS